MKFRLTYSNYDRGIEARVLITRLTNKKGLLHEKVFLFLFPPAHDQ